MKLKKKFLSLLVAGVMVLGSVATVGAAEYDYEKFSNTFNYAVAAPSGTYHFSQSIYVQANAEPYAYARCDSYSYSGNQPVLTITSVETKYPTYSVSFTSKYTAGKGMKYTDSIPIEGKFVQFKGSVSQYGNSFTITASVKG